MQEIAAFAGAIAAPVVVSVLLAAVLIALYRERKPAPTHETGYILLLREVRELSMKLHKEAEQTRDLIRDGQDRAS